MDTWLNGFIGRRMDEHRWTGEWVNLKVGLSWSVDLTSSNRMPNSVFSYTHCITLLLSIEMFKWQNFFNLEKFSANFQVTIEAFLLFPTICFFISISDIDLIILFQYFAYLITLREIALRTTTHLQTRCRKPYAATQYLMLLMTGVCTRNMSS